MEAFKKLGRVVSSFDIRLEPQELKAMEGGTLVWGVDETIKAVWKGSIKRAKT